MLVDVHLHLDSCPQPEELLRADQAAGIQSVALTTSLLSYVRTRLLCQPFPKVPVALGLHPHRVGAAYDPWEEWKQMQADVPIVGEVGLEFRGCEEQWAAQKERLAEICRLCSRGSRLVLLHADRAEAEAWEVLSAHPVRWVVWLGYRAEAPRLTLYRAMEAGHLLAVGPEMARNGALQTRLRAIPREQVLTGTDAPFGVPASGDRATALREILAGLSQVWRCTLEEAEAQVERNWSRIAADLGIGVAGSVAVAG